MNPERASFDGLNLILSGTSLPDLAQMAQQAAPQLGLSYLDGDADLAQLLGETHTQTRERFGIARLKLDVAAWLEITVLRRSSLIFLSPDLLLLGDALSRLLPISIVLVPYLALGEALRARHQAWGERFHDAGQRALLKEALHSEDQLRRKPGVAALEMSGQPLAERIVRLAAYWRQHSLQ